MIVFLTTVVAGWLVVAQSDPAPKMAEKKVVEVVVEVGNGKFVDDPKKPVPTTAVTMDAKGRFRRGKAGFEPTDAGVLVATELKGQDFVRLRIDLDDAAETPAVLILRVVDRITKSVPDGKRVELTFSYTTEAGKK